MKAHQLSKLLVFSALFGALSENVQSQGRSPNAPGRRDNPPGNSGNAPGHNKNVPFDAGIGLLVGAGLAYGLKRAYTKKKSGPKQGI